MKSIKLVAQPTNNRAIMFHQLLGQKELSSKYKVIDLISIELDEDAHYNILFDGDCLNKDMVNSLISLKERSDSVGILDISINKFDNDHVGFIQTLAVSCAKFVSCADAVLQEIVYEMTGRLSCIVEEPLITEEFKEADTNSNVSGDELEVLWYGDAEEVFSVKKYETGGKHKNLKVLVKPSERQLNKAMNSADIVFLPKTFTIVEEDNRLRKVEDCLLRGKLVAAPDLDLDTDNLAFNMDLQTVISFYMETSIAKFIKQKQVLLREKKGVGNSVNQLLFTLREAPHDNYHDGLDTFMLEDIIE